MAIEDESNEEQFQWQALMHQASRFTYCLIDRTKEVIGTAIAISLGEQFFFATAKHEINNNNELEILSRGPVAPITTSDFVAKHFHHQIDIGLLEIKPDAADRFNFADRTQLLPNIDENCEWPTLVVGYPNQFIRSAETKITIDVLLRVHRCDALTFRSVVLPRSEWPDNDLLKEPLVCGRDLLVDFKAEPQVRTVTPGKSISDKSKKEYPETDPHGLSGGAIWLANVEDRNGLRVSNVCLLGIQTGWYERNGWLRGVRIGEWISLVKSKYPELRNLV